MSRTLLAPVPAPAYTRRPMTPGRDAPREPRGERSTKLGRDLTSARLRAGLTQEQLAERFMVDAATLGRWETGATKPRGLYEKVVEKFIAARPATDD